MAGTRMTAQSTTKIRYTPNKPVYRRRSDTPVNCSVRSHRFYSDRHQYKASNSWQVISLYSFLLANWHPFSATHPRWILKSFATKYEYEQGAFYSFMQSRISHANHILDFFKPRILVKRPSPAESGTASVSFASRITDLPYSPFQTQTKYITRF